MAKAEGLTDLLYPLFAHNIRALLEEAIRARRAAGENLASATISLVGGSNEQG